MFSDTIKEINTVVLSLLLQEPQGVSVWGKTGTEIVALANYVRPGAVIVFHV